MGVVFVAAGLALRPTPGVNIYAATKSMENFFGQALAVEFAATIDTVVVHPLGVSTSMMPEKPDGLVVISPRKCAKATLRQLGHSWARYSWTNGWFFHELQWPIMANAPNFVFNKIWMEIMPAKMEKMEKTKMAAAEGYKPAP